MPFVSKLVQVNFLVLAGFCETSLAKVERLNLDSLSQPSLLSSFHTHKSSSHIHWEEVSPLNAPRTKFCTIHTQTPNGEDVILVMGGKD